MAGPAEADATAVEQEELSGPGAQSVAPQSVQQEVLDPGQRNDDSESTDNNDTSDDEPLATLLESVKIGDMVRVKDGDIW